ncbi:MAG: ABC transporter ATP-binding protein [Candidatus Delongbacteria bacterium]
MGSQSEVVLDVRGLGKSYGRRRVLDALDFRLHAGEVLGFLGPNGAGKSTTLRILTSLVRPDEGGFQLLGERFPGGRRRAFLEVGALIERADLYPQLSARRNLRMLGRLQGMDDPARVEEVLQLVGLARRADEPVRVFSQGMKQRLGLAQAILHRPRVLLLDEPMTGLDPGGMRRMRDWIRHLAHDQGMAVLFSSHLLPEVEQLADRLLVLHRGRKVAEGAPGDLFEQAGGRRWELVCDQPARAAELLRPWLEEGRVVEEHGARLSFRAAGLPAERVLAELARADIGLREFRSLDSLEDLLLAVAGEEELC